MAEEQNLEVRQFDVLRDLHDIKKQAGLMRDVILCRCAKKKIPHEILSQLHNHLQDAIGELEAAVHIMDKDAGAGGRNPPPSP